MNSVNEKFANLVQEATVMVSRTASPDEDMVKSAGDLARTLTEQFEEGGLDRAKTYLDAVTEARQKGAEPKPDFS